MAKNTPSSNNGHLDWKARKISAFQSFLRCEIDFETLST